LTDEKPTSPADPGDWQSTNLWNESRPTPLSAGMQIGGYTIRDVIGQGGFGVVYLAEQTRPVQRQVALKVIKPGMDSAAVIARFEAERQALAVMNHPHVAKVFDGGTTPDGRPYFVMEYVQGKPITAYCDEKRLNVEERINLFVQVCDAVQHAHMKGLIHRDLKPANILIEERADSPTPKVIDFGVAKALQRDVVDRVTYTQAGELIGTPEYMSPEQADAKGLDIDTRSDVYSLGVVLYELLTGSPPFDAKTLFASGYTGLQHIISEVDPPRPSSRLTTMLRASKSSCRSEETPSWNEDSSRSQQSLDAGETPEEVAAERRSDSRSLVRLLRGDLDWIVMKCLEKDRERRYESAAALAMDVKRHLNNEPVLAGPPSTIYRLKKFVRRNRASVLAGSSIAAVLVIATCVSILFALDAIESERRAEAQAAEAHLQGEIAAAVNAFLTDDLIKAVSPDRLGRDVSMREALDATAVQLSRQAADGRFRDKPEVKAGIHRAIGQTYQALGLYEEALLHLARQLELLQLARGDDDVMTLEAHHDVGIVYRRMGQHELAREHTFFAYEGLRTKLGDDDPKTIDAVASIGSLYLAQRQLDEAERYFGMALEGHRRILGDDDPKTLTAVNNMGALLRAKGDNEAAEPYYRDALDGFRRVYGDDHPDTLTAINNMAVLLRSLDRMDEAMPYYIEALEGRRRVLGNDHDRTLTSINNMGHLLQSQGLLDEALEFFREAYDGFLRVLGEEHPFTLNAMQSVGQVLRAQGKIEEAEPYYRESLRLMRETRHPRVETAMSNLSVLLRSQGRHEEAEPVAQELYEFRLSRSGIDHPQTIVALRAYSDVLREIGKLSQCEAMLRDAMEVVELTDGEAHHVAGIILTSLSRTYIAMERIEEAQVALEQALDIFSRTLGEDHGAVVEARELFVLLQKSN
jgi:eukaryotic-like serine/threonine-protein kinase